MLILECFLLDSMFRPGGKGILFDIFMLLNILRIVHFQNYIKYNFYVCYFYVVMIFIILDLQDYVLVINVQNFAGFLFLSCSRGG